MSPPASTLISATRDDGYYLSTDASKLEISRIYEWISTDCYWAIGRPFDVVLGSIENSLPVGVYTIDSAGNTHEQVAFARVVTDYYTFAWVDDIYVSRRHRQKGLSHFIIDTVNTLLRTTLGIKHIVLFTHDAQSLYSKHGYEIFSELNRQRWMSLPNPKSQENA